MLSRVRGRGKIRLRPEFTIALRADDAVGIEIVKQAIQSYDDSAIPSCSVVYPARHRNDIAYERQNRNPTARAVWGSIASVQAICRLLDEHPLLNKKADDYGIWREAVDLRYSGERRENGSFIYTEEKHEKLMSLKQAMEEGRKYH